MSGGAMSSVVANVGGQSQSLHKVFVYGSLMAEDVCRVLLNRVPQSSPALLNGYHRYSIKGRVYPAILPVENKTVAGKVLLGITDPELHILDEYESSSVDHEGSTVDHERSTVEYERSTVEVSLMDTSESLLVQAYVWTNKNDPNLYADWDFEEWKQLHMKEFVKMISGFMEELELREAQPRVAT